LEAIAPSSANAGKAHSALATVAISGKFRISDLVLCPVNEVNEKTAYWFIGPGADGKAKSRGSGSKNRGRPAAGEGKEITTMKRKQIRDSSASTDPECEPFDHLMTGSYVTSDGSALAFPTGWFLDLSTGTLRQAH
jgi:hypothetical protein